MTYLPTTAIFFAATLGAHALSGLLQGVISPEVQWAGSLGVGGFVAWWSLRINQNQAAAHKQQIVELAATYQKQHDDRDAANQAQLLAIITQNGIRENRSIEAQEKTVDAILKFTATVEQFATLERVIQVVERRKPDDKPAPDSTDRRQS